MDTYFTESQKQLIKEYIDSRPIKAVEIFDYKNRQIKYSNLIKNADTISVIRGDEEIVRAYFLTRLVNDLGYSLNSIEVEREFSSGRPAIQAVKSRIDVIVHHNDNECFLFAELKSPHDYHVRNLK